MTTQDIRNFRDELIANLPPITIVEDGDGFCVMNGSCVMFFGSRTECERYIVIAKAQRCEITTRASQ